MAVSRRAFGSVLRGLRAIREASPEDVIAAMRERASSLEPTASVCQPAFELLTAAQLCRLEQSEELETNVHNLFLLAETLGVGIGHLFWFVDLVLPRDGVTAHPTIKQVDASLDSSSAWNQFIKRMEEPCQQKLPITESEALELYSATGLVSDAKFRNILLRRFLRTPFPADRYQIGIVGRQDLEMSPVLGPGTLLFIDTLKEVAASSELCPLNAFYWGIYEGRHRCIWPHDRDGLVLYMMMDPEGVWSEVRDAEILGVPLSSYWQIDPLDLKNFYVPDFRDQDTEFFIRVTRMAQGEDLAN